jgi:2-methylcitrate dehydratase PrpD
MDYILTLGGKPEATLLGTPHRLKIPAMYAALGNGVSGHALDMDDGFRYGGVHPGVSTIPAALAACEIKESDGKGLILATALGSEFVDRLAKAMNPSHLNRGFHTTGTLGPFGAVVAAGKTYGLDEAQFTRAIGLAGLQGAGLLEILHDGAMAKAIHPGKAGLAGILSVELARRGARGPESVLEGEKGFFKAMSDEVNTESLLEGLGEKYLVLDQYIKLHAACRHVHPAVDAVIQLKKDHSIKFEDIDSINVSTYPVAVSFCGSESNPKSGEAAKFSLSFSTAMAAFYNDAGMNRFSVETVENQEIQQLASRVTVSIGDKWTQSFPEKKGASVDIVTKDGKQVSMEVENPKGEPEFPPTEDELINKFRDNAAKIPPETSNRLISVIRNLDRHKIADLVRLFHF